MFTTTVFIGTIVVALLLVWFRKNKKSIQLKAEEKKRRFRSISNRFPPSPLQSPQAIQQRREKILEAGKKLLLQKRNDVFTVFYKEEEEQEEDVENLNEISNELADSKPSPKHLILNNEVVEGIPPTNTRPIFEESKEDVEEEEEEKEEEEETPIHITTSPAPDETPIPIQPKESTEKPSEKILDAPSDDNIGAGDEEVSFTAPANLFTFLAESGNSDKILNCGPKLFASNLFDCSVNNHEPPKITVENVDENYKLFEDSVSFIPFANRTLSDQTMDKLFNPKTGRKTPYDEQTLLQSLVNKKGNQKLGYRNIFNKRGAISQAYKTKILAAIRRPPPSEIEDEEEHEEEEEEHEKHNNVSKSNSINTSSNSLDQSSCSESELDSKLDSDFMKYEERQQDSDFETNFCSSLQNNSDYKSSIPDPYRHFIEKTGEDVELKKRAYMNIFGSAYDISKLKESNMLPNNGGSSLSHDSDEKSEVNEKKIEELMGDEYLYFRNKRGPKLRELDEEQQKINNEKNLRRHKRRLSEGKAINNSSSSNSSLTSVSVENFETIDNYETLNTETILQRNEERTKIRSTEPKLTHDPFDHLLDGVDLHDWNERFQRIMGTIRKFNNNTPIPLQIRANRELIHLAQDFIYASSTYGKIIISEVYCQEKTIKPINIGGKLGGTKYIVQNILFKFAVDEYGFYSDYAAAKVAGHELKGLISYFNCNIEDLCLPLMSLVDYRGFRLIAMSILPIRGSKTIIYGSDDYGNTIYNEDETMENLVKKAAKMMNIKEHRCGMNLQYSGTLCGPADLEGHIGTDKRFYLLDFSRVLPPEAPQEGIRNSHLYRLLRPELVKLYEKPLSSDAFSSFIALHDYKSDNREVVEATRNLIDFIIPKFAEELTAMMIEEREKGKLESFRLTEAIHSYGINVRYIGLLRKYTTELDCRTYLLVEMCSRVVKNKLRKLLRKKMKKLKVPLEEPYRSLVISYLNLVLGDSEASEEYWNNNIKRALKRQFVLGLTETEARADYSLKSSLNNFSNDRVDGKLLLFLRLQQMTGLRFTTRVVEEFTQNPNNWAPRGGQPLDETDLEDIGLRVKHMNIISHAQGFVLQMKGAMAWAHDPVAAERFYHMAIKKYEETLDTNPNDAKALIHLAEIAVQFIEGHARGVAAMKYDWDVPAVQNANNLFRRAVQANPNDSYGLFRYATFLDKCDLPELAEDYFLRSLEADPENVACLQEYGNFLTERGNHTMAEFFYLRGTEVASKYTF